MQSGRAGENGFEPPSGEPAPARSASTNDRGLVLEACRNYLLLVANRELEAELRAKIAPSDLVQDSLLEAQLAIGRFHGTSEADLLAWLRRILLNNIANARQGFRSTGKREIRREVPLDLILESPLAEELVTTEPSPSKNAIARERREELERAISTLTADHREVLRLRHQENCSFEEIGRRLGRSSEAARKLWARGVEQLKQILPHDNFR